MSYSLTLHDINQWYSPDLRVRINKPAGKNRRGIIYTLNGKTAFGATHGFLNRSLEYHLHALL